MYIYLTIYEIITTITMSNTPAPTAPITASMSWPVFSDSNSTKSKLLNIEKFSILDFPRSRPRFFRQACS